MVRTANPALKENMFTRFGATEAPSHTMTIQGTVNKTAILLACCVVAAAVTWSMVAGAIEEGMEIGAAMAVAGPWVWGGMIGGLVLAIITILKPAAAPFTSPLYAGCEGFFLGGISALFEAMYPGIVFQAVGLTFGVLFALLIAYTSRLIRATENFKLGVCAATGGIFLLYMVSFVLSLFGTTVPFIHDSGWFGIGFSLFVVVIASLNLVLDFDFIEKGAKAGAPKYMEWYGAFGLLVTLVWLYLEILRLLAKLQRR